MVALEQTITGLDTGSGITLTSWTPAANELVLVCVFERNELLATTISGNGLTWVQVIDVNDSQGQCGLTIWRGMSASPSAGSITLGNTSGFSYAVACRFSGVDTSGTNGSGAIEATNSATTGGTDNNDITVSVTTLTDNAWALGFVATHGGGTLTLVDETTISINNTAGSGGDTVTAHAFYQVVVSAGATTLLGSNSFSKDREWAIAAVSIKPASGTTFTQSNSGTLTSSGALIRKAKKVAAGTLTTAGAIIRKAKKVVAGTLTTAGAARRKGKKVLTGTLTSSGAVTAFRKFFKVLAGTLTSGGALVRKPKKVLVGTLTTGGAFVKKTFKTLAGTLTSSGGLTSQILQIFYQAVGGTLTTAGTLTRKAKKTLSGILTSSGALIRKAKKSIGGILTSSGGLSQGIAAAAVALTVAARAVLTFPNRLQTWAVAVRNTFTVRNK